MEKNKENIDWPIIILFIVSSLCLLLLKIQLNEINQLKLEKIHMQLVDNMRVDTIMIYEEEIYGMHYSEGTEEALRNRIEKKKYYLGKQFDRDEMDLYYPIKNK